MNDLQDVASVVGLVLGSCLILAVCVVWLRKQTFGMGGSVMSLAGVTLAGLTVWSNVKFQVGPDGGVTASFERRVEELEKNVMEVSTSVETVAAASAESSRDIATLADTVTANRQQMVALARDLASTRDIRPEVLAPIEQAPATQLDRNAIDLRTRRLETLRPQ